MGDFDWVFYVNFYIDIKSSTEMTKEKALEHYNTHGRSENRKTHLDVGHYMRSSDSSSGESMFSFQRNNNLSTISKRFVSYVLRDIKLLHEAKIMEIGCGIACLSLPIIKYVASGVYYGVDTDTQCIEWCRHRILPVCPNMIFESINDENLRLPCGDNTLDVVYSATLFNQLQYDDIINKLMEINRVLKKGGQLVIGLMMCNQPSHLNIVSKKNHTKTTKIGGSTYLSNNLGESVIVHPDTVVKIFKQASFSVDEIIFGTWSGTSKSDTYRDIMRFIKI